MSDRDVQRSGQRIGVGVKKGTKPVYDQRYSGPHAHLFNIITPNQRNLRPGIISSKVGTMSDIAPENLTVGTRMGEGRPGEVKNAEYDLPLKVAIANHSAASATTWDFDQMNAAGTAVAAGATVDIVTIPITQGIEAVVEMVGWFTVGGPAAAALTFGLYIGNELMLPGGRYVGDQQRTVLDYNPSNGSIDPRDLLPISIPVSPDQNIVIRVTNIGAAAFNAFGRIKGRHWEEEKREGGGNAYYNTKQDKISG